MTDDVGGTTQDLLALKQPHPAEAGIPAEDTDEAARRFGNHCLRRGLYIAGGTFITALCCAAAAGDDALDKLPDARMFAILGITAAMLTGAALVIVGGVDRLLRPGRAMGRKMILDRIADANRIERIEHAIDAIAEHMPESQAIQHWRGFGAAARQVLSETGTDGPPAKPEPRVRPLHLGLVPRDRQSRED